MDIDGNGMIDLEEFCLCMARHVAASRQRAQQQQQQSSHRSLSTQQLRDAFNFFDKVGIVVGSGHMWTIHLSGKSFSGRSVQD